MNIKVYKEYRFAFGKLVATDTGKEYTFSISRNDRFYHNMEKHITKEKVESLSYANIDDIYIEDKAGKDSKDVLTDFLCSKTGKALYNKNTRLWCNNPSYIAELYMEELSNK